MENCKCICENDIYNPKCDTVEEDCHNGCVCMTFGIDKCTLLTRYHNCTCHSDWRVCKALLAHKHVTYNNH